MKPILEKLHQQRLYFDGGSGTLLQKMGLKPGELPESWNLIHPERVVELHSGYLKAGVDVFNTNTFGANRIHYPDNLEEIVRAGVRLGKQAIKETGRSDAYVALDIGPTGKLLEPLGDLSFEDAVELFAEIVRYGASEGADLVMIETMTDSYEAKAALLAAKENCDLPVFITCTFDATGKLLTGGTVKSLVPMLEGLGADAVGINCSLGPNEMVPIVKQFLETANVPVIVNPNAGLPKTRNGMTVFDVLPEEFSDIMKEIAGLGAKGIGGCCGTTPSHITKTIEKVKEVPFCTTQSNPITIVSSYSSYVEIGGKTKIIGERINPTGKKKFQQALRDHNIDYILSQAIEQEDAGADILDVNVGLPDIDEKEMMTTVIRRLQGITSLPLQIDSPDPKVLEQALRIYNGKPLINSVNGKEESIHAVLPLAKKYGAAVVALCLDEQGIPSTADGRIAIAKRILEAADHYGIPRRDIIIDGLTMTVSSDPLSARTTLDTVYRASHELGCATVLGVSNISFGLPQRALLNSNFLSMAMANGLSCAIINPNNASMLGALRSSNALLNQDEHFEDYINAYAGTEELVVTTVNTASAPKQNVEADASLRSAILRGITSQSERLTEELLKTTEDPLTDIVNAQLIPALDEVGKGFEAGTVFLPQLLMSADAAKASFAVIRAAMQDHPQEIKGRVILATVKNDIHDIGKNIVKVMLENYGYDVIDLGKDVDPEVIVETAVKENIRLVGLSALMTTTVVSMEETIRQLRAAKPDTKVVVGGAVMTQEYADKIGADAYAKDAMATVRYADSIFVK
ncbi:MAG: homocysteine S-methyltransferase family protein [Solobacterium sp.]|nr:homocysteine S-methyltransferase family protein [Solobacterium sp.]